MRWEECPRQPSVYFDKPPGPEASRWVIYFPWQGANEDRIKECQVAIVHGQTGEVLHLGGAGDEG